MPNQPYSPSRRGRPKKTKVDALRVRTWFEAVRSISGLSSAYAIEKDLHPESFHRDKGWVSRPQRWDHYETGTRVPSRELVAYVESVYPGTAVWLQHPIWKALLPHPRSPEEINDELRSLGGVIHFLLFRPQPDLTQPERYPFNEQMVGMLSELGTLDALATAILLIHESVAIASEALRTLALRTYRELQPAIAARQPLFGVHPDLFSYIDLHYPEWIFISPNQRMRTVVFWESYRDSNWPEETARKSRELCDSQDAKKALRALRSHSERLRRAKIKNEISAPP